MSDKEFRGRTLTAKQIKERLNAETESALNCATTAVLQNWKPSTCLCPNCGSSNTLINTTYVLASYPEQYGFKCRNCGHQWTGHKHFGIPPVTNWPNLEEDIIVTPRENFGWICPQCGAVYAPNVTECKRCSAPWSPTITCTDTLGGATNVAPNSVNGGSNIVTVGELKRADYQAWREKNNPVSTALKYESFKQQHGE